ncbi:MAG: alpha/beta fold hydrolase [Myxococcaceae bacterium]
MLQPYIRFYFLLAIVIISGCSESESDNCPDALAPDIRAVAQCSILEVPQNRTRNTGITLKLPIVRFNSPVRSSKPPLLYLEGGPGASALSRAEMQGPGLAKLLQRDIIFLEQRGTINTSPSLVCKANDTEEQCKEQWKQDRIDLPSYNTIESAEDVAQLSKNLRTPFVIWGSSYGTLLAQRVVQRHPEVVDSLILEGSIPSDSSDHFTAANKVNKLVLGRFAQWIKKKWSEAQLSPFDIDPEIDFPEAIQKVAKFPFGYGVPGTETLANVEYFMQVGRNLPKLQLSLALWAYNVHHDLEQKQSAEWLESLLFGYGQRLLFDISHNMHFATNCSDAYQFWSIYEISQTESNSGMPENIEKLNMTNRSQLLRSCKGLGRDPSGYPAYEFRIPAKTYKNTLFLIGMLDTQTPAEFAPVSNFPNAKIARAECLGHSFFVDPSLFGILKSFLETPNAPIPTYLIDAHCNKPIEKQTLKPIL